MITLWVLYCFGVSALLAGAAAACDYFLHGRGLPVRWAWTCAIAGSLLLPAWGLATSTNRPASPPAPKSASQAAVSLSNPDDRATPPIGISASEIPARQSWAETILASARPLIHVVSPLVLVAWLMSSLCMAMLLLGGWLRIRAQRSRWRSMSLGGREVMISHRTGPAVVGFVHPSIVLPEWILQLEDVRRDLVLLHEEEHLRAHDERLLLLASVVLIPMPWNVALWYQLRRLRLAVEIDCDTRVLRVHPNARDYGDLLLDVGRRVNSGALQMAALSEPVSFLARRISAMMVAPKQSRSAAIFTFLATVTAVAIACQTPRPPAPAFGTSLRPTYSGDARVGTEVDSIPSMVVWNGERMTRDSLVRRLYGTTLSGKPSGVLEFVIDADNVVISTGVRSGPTVYRATDSTVIRRGLDNGYSRVAPADVASIEIDRTRYGFPEITSVVWVQLKPGARVEDAQAERPASGTGIGRLSEQGRASEVIGSVTADARPQPFMMSPSEAASFQRLFAQDESQRVSWAAEGEKFGATHAAALAELRKNLTKSPAVFDSGFGPNHREGDRSYAPPVTPLSRDAMLAVAGRYYPELINDPPASPVTLWFLADTTDRVIETHVERATLGMVSLGVVLRAFPDVTRERVRSWTVTSPYPFGMVWVRVKR